jgi:hypothetical protein
MAFLNFSENLYVKEMDSNEETGLGGMSPAVNGDLAHMRVFVYIKGTIGGSETIKVNFYGDELTNNLLFSSSKSNLSNINPSPNNYLGWVKVDFDRQPLNKNITYYPSLQLENYTRNGETYVIGIVYDWPAPTYATGVNIVSNASYGFQVFMYQE